MMFSTSLTRSAVSFWSKYERKRVSGHCPRLGKLPRTSSSPGGARLRRLGLPSANALVGSAEPPRAKAIARATIVLRNMSFPFITLLCVVLIHMNAPCETASLILLPFELVCGSFGGRGAPWSRPNFHARKALFVLALLWQIYSRRARCKSIFDSAGIATHRNDRDTSP